MSKPIGHYTGYVPGDGCFLESLQEQYGASLEQMSTREQIFLIAAISRQLSSAADGDIRTDVYQLGNKIPVNLLVRDQEGLLEALITQVRGQNAEPVHHS